MKKIYREIKLILIISLILSLVRYLFIYDDYDLIKKSRINDVVSTDSNNIHELIQNIDKPTKIDMTTAKIIFDSNLALFIDARDVDSFNETHIRGAINVPTEFILDEVNVEDVKEILEFDGIKRFDSFSFILFDEKYFIESPVFDYQKNEYKRNLKDILVVYCSGSGCSLSEELSFFLYDHFNLNKILIYEGGMPEWNLNKFPIGKK